jgi:hypothetical protein
MRAKRTRCLVCDQLALLTRGQCGPCYKRTRKRVADGETDWETQELLGLAVPPAPERRRVLGPARRPERGAGLELPAFPLPR